MPRHAHDAAGPPELLAHKAELRSAVWDALDEAGVSRFPGAEGRIPNFTGAEAAAEQLRRTELWRRARTLKANPDSPQWPVRQRALQDGKVVYMAVPRLADPHPFFLLDPGRLEESPRRASSIKGASRNGRMVALDELEPVDLVVVGSVAVGRDGARLGKGGGFSDLEYVLALEAGLVDAGTPVVTTVHPLQVRDAGVLPMTAHDVPVDVFVTPEECVETARTLERPSEILWEELSPQKIGAIPLLEALREARTGDGRR